MCECAISTLKVFHVEDRAPDVEEPVVKDFEKSSAELAEEDNDKKGPDVVDIEAESSMEDYCQVFQQECSIYSELTFETAIALFGVFLLLLGGQGENQVVHVEVADPVQDTLENGCCLGVHLPP